MEVYEGPQLTPPRVSLLSSAEVVPMDGNERWYAGFDLINEGCGGTGIYLVCPPADADPKDFETYGANEEYNPFVLYATDKCSTFPAGRDFYGRAERKLLAAEARMLEAQLWDGSLQSNNPFLSDGAGAVNDGPVTTIPSPASGDSWDAFALMDQQVAVEGSRGMIHLRPQVLHQLLDHNVVRREGNVYLSPMDNIVVPGRGYPGTGPADEAVGATEWMYGHPGIVQIRRGPIIRVGEGDLSSQVDRSVNDRLVVVERVVHVALDTSCGVYAIEFDSIAPAA